MCVSDTWARAFHIVKAFIELGTHNSIESLQALCVRLAFECSLHTHQCQSYSTNTHIPSPYWVAVAPVLIPLQTCNRAADVLIEWFGPEDLSKVVGGERWWQVRGLDGIEAEWVTERKFLRDDDIVRKAKERQDEREEKLSPTALDILKMDSLERVMVSETRISITI